MVELSADPIYAQQVFAGLLFLLDTETGWHASAVGATQLDLIRDMALAYHLAPE